MSMLCSQRVEPGEEVRISFPARRSARLGRRIDLLERFTLRLQIGARVVIGRVQRRVPKPVADYRHIDTSGDELDTDTVTPSVGCYAFCRERRHVPGGPLNILLELEANSSSAERLTVSVGEDRFVICARLSSQKGFEHVHRFRPQRADSTLAPLPKQLNLSLDSKQMDRGHTSSASWIRAPVLYRNASSA